MPTSPTLLPESHIQATRIWTNCAQTIRAQVSDAAWKSTFVDATAVEFTKDFLVVKVPTQMHRMRIERRFLSIVNAAVDEALPGACVRIEIDTNQTAVKPDQIITTSKEGREAAHRPKPAEARGTEPTDSTSPSTYPHTHTPTHPHTDRTETISGRLSVGLSKSATNNTTSSVIDTKASPSGVRSRLTFDHFVTGTSNRFAHAAALAVAEQPAQDYNPLFIYGRSGLGKTHLLQAITNYRKTHFPDHTVKYAACETLLNDLVTAIKTNTQQDFQRQYRKNTILLIDDIQFLQNKEGLQEEFFHTFNDLLNNGGQIVTACDRPPSAIPKLEHRLKSRFHSGLITDIQLPSLETRLAILQRKAESRSIHIPQSILSFIATNVTDSIRELEGALIKVIAYANLSAEPCTLASAKELLSDVFQQTVKAPVTLDLILEVTTQIFGFTREQLTGTSRRKPLVEARQIAMYATRKMTDLSFPEIGRNFDRDHTTVMHACKKIESHLSEKKHIFTQVNEFEERLHQIRSTPARL